MVLVTQHKGFSIMPTDPKKKRCAARKVVVLGDCGVGKTTLLRQLVHFNENDNPNDYYSKVAVVDGAAPIKVQLWDTAGQEKFGAARLPTSFFRHAHAAIVVYDVSDRHSFESVLRWVKQLEDYRSESFPLLLVGNKCDVVGRQVSAAEGLVVAKTIGACGFFECSKDNTKVVDDCFTAIANALIQLTP